MNAAAIEQVLEVTQAVSGSAPLGGQSAGVENSAPFDKTLQAKLARDEASVAKQSEESAQSAQLLSANDTSVPTAAPGAAASTTFAEHLPLGQFQNIDPELGIAKAVAVPSLAQTLSQVQGPASFAQELARLLSQTGDGQNNDEILELVRNALTQQNTASGLAGNNEALGHGVARALGAQNSLQADPLASLPDSIRNLLAGYRDGAKEPTLPGQATEASTSLSIATGSQDHGSLPLVGSDEAVAPNHTPRLDALLEATQRILGKSEAAHRETTETVDIPIDRTAHPAIHDQQRPALDLLRSFASQQQISGERHQFAPAHTQPSDGVAIPNQLAVEPVPLLGTEQVLAPASSTAISSPPVTPEPAPLATLPENIPQYVELLATRGGGSVRLQLQPAHLGELNLAVTLRGSAVDIAVIAQEPAAAHLVASQRDVLGDALASRDLRMENFDVSNGEERDLRGFDRDAAQQEFEERFSLLKGDEHPAAGSSHNVSEDHNDEPVAPVPAQLLNRGVMSQRVDLRV